MLFIFGSLFSFGFPEFGPGVDSEIIFPAMSGTFVVETSQFIIQLRSLF